MTGSPDTRPVALITSVAREAAALLRALEPRDEVQIGPLRAVEAALDGRSVVLLATGMGKANAAHGLTALALHYRLGGLIAFGIAGAYPDSGLAVGDLALATSEVYGDEGVLTPYGWISTEHIGIPLMSREGQVTFNDFELSLATVEAARGALGAAGKQFVAGPFVTVSACSGTEARGMELARRHSAVCETMEGAALVHVAALHGIPALDVRGISNLVEDRDLSRWRIDEAAETAAEAVQVLLRAGIFQETRDA